MAKTKKGVDFEVVNPHCAGIDVGGKFHVVAIGQSEEETVQFDCFTEDLHSMCQYLVKHGIKSAAMESTGIYWKPLYLMLLSYDIEVLVCNPGYLKSFGKKTDRIDSRWIQKLHAVGLLKGSFHPDNFTDELRELVRHRQILIASNVSHVQRMQKQLVLMNIRLPEVINDLMGKSGQSIINAILSGERDALKLASLADRRCKANLETLAKALTGTWSDQHLFLLSEHYQFYQFTCQKLRVCDQHIEKLLAQEVKKKSTTQTLANYEPKHDKQSAKNNPTFAIDKYAYQLLEGVDLMQIPGISYNILLPFLAEMGACIVRFPTAKHWTSWLALAPNNKVSGGKVISRKTRSKKLRLKNTFLNAASGLHNANCPLGDDFRRLRACKGHSKALTAIARKLAVIVYNLVTKKEAYDPSLNEQKEAQQKQHSIKRIRLQMAKHEITVDDLVLKKAN